jgi:hypothetical protein
MAREDEIREKNKRLKNPEKYSLIFPQDQSGFSAEDYQEIKQAVIEKVIKPNKNNWEVKKILVMNGIYGRQENDVLIHKTAKLKYDSEGILIEDLGKIHYKRVFDDEEWTEIENILNEQQEEIPQQEQPPKEAWYKSFFYFRGSVNSKY